MSEPHDTAEQYRWKMTLESADEVYVLGRGRDTDYSRAVLKMMEDVLDDDHYDLQEELYSFEIEMIVGAVHQLIDDEHTDDLAKLVNMRAAKIRELGTLEFYRGPTCPVCDDVVPAEAIEFDAAKGTKLRFHVTKIPRWLAEGYTPKVTHPRVEVE